MPCHLNGDDDESSCSMIFDDQPMAISHQQMGGNLGGSAWDFTTSRRLFWQHGYSHFLNPGGLLRSPRFSNERAKSPASSWWTGGFKLDCFTAQSWLEWLSTHQKKSKKTCLITNDNMHGYKEEFHQCKIFQLEIVTVKSSSWLCYKTMYIQIYIYIYSSTIFFNYIFQLS